jgi:maleylacetoacetate isomerase
MRLYGYWRSGAAYRLRIAYAMKGLAYEAVPINLLIGAQRSAAFLATNPLGLVPARELDNGAVLTQSLAILDWLERSYPTPTLLPADAVARAQKMAAGMAIAVDTHPVQNVCFVNYLKSAYGPDTLGATDRICHWMCRGFAAYQQMCRPDAGFSFGDQPGYADICQALPAFDAARRKNQPDAT